MEDSRAIAAEFDQAYGRVPQDGVVDINRPNFTDANLNYEIKEIPMGNPMALELERAGGFGGLGSPNIPNPEMMQDLSISDPSMRPFESGMSAAGIATNARNYKMASDIFGTGMDRSWNDSPKKSEHSFSPTQSLSPPAPVSHRNEPSASSFKITEFPSDGSGSADSANSPASRKARESKGNPLTGQGYRDESTKTAKRYYEGSNTNQKLW